MSYSTEVDADNPNVWYRHQEASGAPQDSSGNARHWDAAPSGATYQVASPIAREGSDFAIRSASWSFTPDNAVLDLGDVLTLELWLKRERTATEEYLLNKGAGAYALVITTGDAVKFQNFATLDNICTMTATIVDTNWHHVVVTKNGATVAMYLDRVDVTGSVTNSTLGDTTDSLNFLRDNLGARNFQGSVDEIALYPTALSSTRVQAHYDAAVFPPPTIRTVRSTLSW